MKNKIETAVAVLGIALCVSACAKAKDPLPASLPSGWYRLPENETALQEEAQVSEEVAGAAFDNALDAQREALEQTPVEIAPAAGLSLLSKDFAPWHLSAFMTDLSVSAKGVFGSLFLKGTPAVSLVWRKKEHASAHSALSEMAEVAGSGPNLMVSEETTDSALASQIDAAVQAAMATGKIQAGAPVRENLRRAAIDFLALTRGLESNPGKAWWISRFRMDVSVDASGKVAYFSSIGTEIRLRFEWHRMKSAKPKRVAPGLLSAAPPEAKRSFDELVHVIASDLEAVSSQAGVPHGFQPHSFRVGVGVSAGFTFGVAKATASVVGHVYFSRDVPRPSVYPRMMTSYPEFGTLAMIEDRAEPIHLNYAKASAIPYENGGVLDQVIYRVSRAAFRKGLRRASSMARFFARRASKVRPGRWGVHELHASYDMSISGKFGIATVAGLAMSDLVFYNEEF